MYDLVSWNDLKDVLMAVRSRPMMTFNVVKAHYCLQVGNRTDTGFCRERVGMC